jgi:hypothetical protein
MKYCELCATSRFGGINLVSFVVNFLPQGAQRNSQDLSRQSGRAQRK